MSQDASSSFIATVSVPFNWTAQHDISLANIGLFRTHTLRFRGSKVSQPSLLMSIACVSTGFISKARSWSFFPSNWVNCQAKGEPVSLNRDNYSLAKQHLLLSNGDLTGDVKAYRLAQSAILYFFRNDIGPALKSTKSAIETIQDKKSDRLLAVLRENQDYLESVESSAVSNMTSTLLTDKPTATIQYVENVYVSYAWGDRTTEEGIKRESVVDLLCTSLAKQECGWVEIKTTLTLAVRFKPSLPEIARSNGSSLF